MAEEPVEVAPTAHYGMGGVSVDDDGEPSRLGYRPQR
jgi:succinate dehydrogenase / fumarate reductase flavoprotein subunit